MTTTWSQHHTEEGTVYYFNSATGESTYSPPPTMPKRPMSRSASFVKSEAQRKLLSSLPGIEDSSTGDVVDPPTSPTHGRVERVPSTWKTVKPRKSSGPRHQQAIALAAEPSLSMAATFTQDATVRSAAQALGDGKLLPPSEHAALVRHAKAAVAGETYLPPHPLNDEEEKEVPAPAAVWEEISAQVLTSTPIGVPAEAFPIGGSDSLTPSAEETSRSHPAVTPAHAPPRRTSPPNGHAQHAQLMRTTSSQPHCTTRAPADGDPAAQRHGDATEQPPRPRLTPRPSSAPPATSTRRPRRSGGACVVLARTHLAASKSSVLPQIPEGAEAPSSEPPPAAEPELPAAHGRHRVSTSDDSDPKAAAGRAAAARAAAVRVAALSSPMLGISPVLRQEAPQIRTPASATHAPPPPAVPPAVACAHEQQDAYHRARRQHEEQQHQPRSQYEEPPRQVEEAVTRAAVVLEPTVLEPRHLIPQHTTGHGDGGRRVQRPRSADSRESRRARAILVHAHDTPDESQRAREAARARQLEQQHAAACCAAALHHEALWQQQGVQRGLLQQKEEELERVRRELEVAQRAAEEAYAREQREAAAAERAQVQNDVLLALLGQPNSGRADRAAQILQLQYRTSSESRKRCRKAVVPLQAAARRWVYSQRYFRTRSAAVHVQRRRRTFVVLRTAALRLQGSARAFLGRLRSGPTRGSLLHETACLRQELAVLRTALKVQRQVGAPATPPTPVTHEGATPPSPVGESTPPKVAVVTKRLAAGSVRPESPSLASQLQDGFKHAMTAVTVFEVPGFLSCTDLVCESHIFSDQLGFAWRLWVKPYDKQDCIGLYLVPAEDLPEPYTADFELAIVGRRGRIWRRELSGGRALLHKRCAGHGWPTFVPRAELEQHDDKNAMLHKNDTLIVTASRISNVRPKSEVEAVEAKAALSKTI